MSEININIGEFICEPPIITNVIYTGTRYIFRLFWNSEGDFYQTFDPSTNLSLGIEIVEISNSQVVYSNTTHPTVPFNESGFQIDIMDYFPSFGNKYRLTFRLDLTSDSGCNNSTTYTVPNGTYP